MIRVLALLVLGACATTRPIDPTVNGEWRGYGIAYGPHRDGQRPGGPSPSREQLREDLALLAPRFGLLRIYGSIGPAPDLLAILREDRLPIKVLLAAWVAPGEDNEAEVRAAAALANEYPELTLGLCVGNETQVSWSAHRFPQDELIRLIRLARSLTKAPICTADDFGFWVLPESAAVGAEIDFVVMHAHPMWNGKQLGEALAFTREKLAEVKARHPGKPVVLGETGWATKKHTEGDQGKLIKGTPGEAEQKVFFDEYTQWVLRERVVSTWFEAFDEAWKGSAHPDEVEKHWGLWNRDRTPKEAVRGR